MSTPPADRSPVKFQSGLRDFFFGPWPTFAGALLLVVLVALYSASHSELGSQISSGESPFFSWLHMHLPELLWLGFSYVALEQLFQFCRARSSSSILFLAQKTLTAGALFSLFVLLLALCRSLNALVAWGHLLLQLSLMLQVLLALVAEDLAGPNGASGIFAGLRKGFLPFFVFLFLIAAIVGYLDPSWQRLQDQIRLVTVMETALWYILPPLLSGVSSCWLGVAILVVVSVFAGLWKRTTAEPVSRSLVSLLPFVAISCLYVGLFFWALVSAINWQLTRLGLVSSIVPLFLVAVAGYSALSYAAFGRLIQQIPPSAQPGLIELVTLSQGVVFFLPFVRMPIFSDHRRIVWWTILMLSLAGSLMLMGLLLYGNLFNPWFTVFSVLKGTLLKVAAITAAGTLSLIYKSAYASRKKAFSGRNALVPLAALCVATFFPFAVLEKYPETKGAILQFRELARVDAIYARNLAAAVDVGHWIRLGQDPAQLQAPDPWPHPWTLKKVAPSLLPRNFNLVVIVVDGLRGDAFHSAGYPRNLTPFLDNWAESEAISFRRAYSQGGGTFAAFPFMVAGRSRFALYGPHLYKENVYFKLARAENINRAMVVRDFGPRFIFPPNYPVIELGGNRSGENWRSVPADEVFHWAEEAIDSLAAEERFLCFLHLMDVHNDLWKKEDGLDFGNSPRDLYDNNVSYVDRSFARFIHWLENKGIYERTVILLTSDHGEQFWEHGASLHGHTLYEEELRIPLILLTHTMRARVEDVPVVAADMVPTIVELAGYSLSPPFEDPHMGISLVPLLLGQERQRYLNRDVVGRASFKRRYFFYHNWQWKLVYFPEFDVLQLFNIVADPQEKKNLLQEEPQVAAELERELLGYLKRVERKSYRPLLSSAWDDR